MPAEYREEIEAKVAAYGLAVEDGNHRMRGRIIRDLLVSQDPVFMAESLMVYAARLLAEKKAIQSCLREKESLLDSMLAAPRRLAKVVGIIRDERNGVEGAWAVVEGPPPLAVRCAPDVDLDDLCPNDWLEEAVWAWLIESEGGLVVGGRITPPPLLQAGIEQEMTVDGFLEGAGNEITYD